MKYILSILFSSYFCCIASGIQLKDKLVYKLAGEVLTLNELSEYHRQGMALECVFKDSLMGEVFADSFQKSNVQYFQVQKNFSEAQKRFLNNYIYFSKLLIYTRSYDIEVNPAIKKYFKLIAQKNNCPDILLPTGKKFNPKFVDMIKLEIFLRNRFLPVELQRQSSTEDMKKAVKAVRSLLKSISDQINQEVYW